MAGVISDTDACEHCKARLHRDMLAKREHVYSLTLNTRHCHHFGDRICVNTPLDRLMRSSKNISAYATALQSCDGHVMVMWQYRAHLGDSPSN